ncbi:sugar kinase [Streptomyces sp. LP11]|uniref:Sugar kinase n=1 Tax=Streptomyces pyxinicus TaxID=2970331 RepID=A0ABT2B394_9ACTN|nr:sugar kinase [Streptomyces sp. LP11]
MVTFLPTSPGRLADVSSFARGIGGAESNVACVLAAHGHTARWVGRVGTDAFGDHLVERIAGYGVDVTHVRRDPDRPTGVYFRTAADRATAAHEVAYYRAGSAASAMSPDTVDLAAARACRVLHLSGITPALSAGCRELVRHLLRPAADRPLISFDVNHRPGLWRSSDGPGILLDLARAADIVFVGEDEAEQAWGVTGGPRAISDALPEPRVVVVKQGAGGATAFERDEDAGGGGEPGRGVADAAGGAGVPARGADASPYPAVGGLGGVGGSSCRAADGFGGSGGSSYRAADGLGGSGVSSCPAADGLAGAAVSSYPVADAPGGAGAPAVPLGRGAAARRATFQRALVVDVVATTGAGDAFAAGFLSATLRGLPVRDRLRYGHLMAAAALTTPGDLAVPPARDHADRLAALDDTAWGRLRLGPGWTQADRPPEEANTP